MLQLQKYSADCILKCVAMQQFRAISSFCRPAPAVIYGFLKKVHENNGSQTGLPLANQHRPISISAPASSKKNFRKLYLGNKRGDKAFKKRRAENPEMYPFNPVETEVKDVGYHYGKAHRLVPEMIPELVVPDLTDCKLKPYVSYRVADIIQEEFSPRELFGYVYQSKIEADFKNEKLDTDGNPLEPSVEEKLDAEKAYLAARRTGSDIFSERIPRLWECIDDFEYKPPETDYSFYPPMRIRPQDQVKVKEIKEKDISEKE